MGNLRRKAIIIMIRVSFFSFLRRRRGFQFKNRRGQSHRVTNFVLEENESSSKMLGPFCFVRLQPFVDKQTRTQLGPGRHFLQWGFPWT